MLICKLCLIAGQESWFHLQTSQFQVYRSLNDHCFYYKQLKKSESLSPDKTPVKEKIGSS